MGVKIRAAAISSGAVLLSLAGVIVGVTSQGTPLANREFFVAPNGSALGNGSADAPWDLATAFAHPSTVTPGDTIWLRGGSYPGPQRSRLRGSPTAPIIVRQFGSERAIIEGARLNHFTIEGSYTWYWGFEVTNNTPDRSTRDRPSGITVSGSGNKLINLAIHDTGQGVLAASGSVNTELYGNIIYHNGNFPTGADDGYGHGIYFQNKEGTLRLVDNVVFNQFGLGLQGYGSSAAFLRNFYLEGNTVFNNGVLCRPNSFSGARNILIGGGTPVVAPVLVENYTYYTPGVPRGGSMLLGYINGALDVVMTNNYFSGDRALQLDCRNAPCSYRNVTGNTVVGRLENIAGTAPALPADNTVISAPPGTGLQVFVRRNRFDPGRSTVTVYNWSRADAVEIDGARLGLSAGNRYRVRAVQDYFADGISGVFEGRPIVLPMQGWSVARPVNWEPAPSSFPQFGVFLVERVEP